MCEGSAHHGESPRVYEATLRAALSRMEHGGKLTATRAHGTTRSVWKGKEAHVTNT
jgi:hypothetical protein